MKAIGRNFQKLMQFFYSALFLVLTSCALSEHSKTHLTTSESAVSLIQQAIEADDVLSFSEALSVETLDKYQNIILMNWSDVREHFAHLFDDIEVVAVDKFSPKDVNHEVPADYVFPIANKALQRVVARVIFDGKMYEENFLFVQEIDDPNANDRASNYIRVRDHVFHKSVHPVPERYVQEGKSEYERTHWRLVFPYYPFQSRSKLTRDLVDALGAEESS